MTVDQQMEELSFQVETDKKYQLIRTLALRGLIETIQYINTHPFYEYGYVSNNRILYKHESKELYAILLKTTEGITDTKKWDFYVLDYSDTELIEKLRSTQNVGSSQNQALIGLLIFFGYAQIVLAIVAGIGTISSSGIVSFLIIFGGIAVGIIFLALGRILERFNQV